MTGKNVVKGTRKGRVSLESSLFSYFYYLSACFKYYFLQNTYPLKIKSQNSKKNVFFFQIVHNYMIPIFMVVQHMPSKLWRSSLKNMQCCIIIIMMYKWRCWLMQGPNQHLVSLSLELVDFLYNQLDLQHVTLLGVIFDYSLLIKETQ